MLTLSKHPGLSLKFLNYIKVIFMTQPKDNREGAATLSITTFSTMTVRLLVLIVTLSSNSTQHIGMMSGESVIVTPVSFG
jgi:hypothetical protein